MKLGQIVTINKVEYVSIKEDEYSLLFIDTLTGEIQSYSRISFSYYKSKKVLNKTYRDLINSPLWVKAKIYEALGIKFVLELI